MIKRILGNFLLLTLLTGSLSAPVLAEGFTVDASEDTTVQVFVDTTDESDEITNIVLSGEEEASAEVVNDAANGATIEVNVDLEPEDSLTEYIVIDESETEESATAGVAAPARTNFYLTVEWGRFSEAPRGQSRPEPTDWDGTVSFDNGTFATPIRTLHFELGEDRIDFANTFAHFTTFESDINDSNDGLLFKVKSDMGADPANGIPFVAFGSTSGFYTAVRLDELLRAGEYTATQGDYQVIFRVVSL